MKLLTLVGLTVLCATAALGNDKSQIERHLEKLSSWIRGVPEDVYNHVASVQGQLYSFYFAAFEGLEKRIHFVKYHYRNDNECAKELEDLVNYEQEIVNIFENIKNNYFVGLEEFREEYTGVIANLVQKMKAINVADCEGECEDLLERSFNLLVVDGTDLFNVLKFKALAADTVSNLTNAFSAANKKTDSFIEAIMEKCH